MRAVFLDTVGLIALWNQSDQWHSRANGAYSLLDPDLTRLVTTPFVLLECANDAARRPYRGQVVALRQQLELARDLIAPFASEIEEAWVEYAKAAAAGAGVVDLISFAVMRRLELTEAFTNDKHFLAAGFATLF